MARRIIYKIENDGVNFIEKEEWNTIMKLQNWYNSEFFWTAGKLSLKNFLFIPNYEDSEERKREYERISLDFVKIFFTPKLFKFDFNEFFTSDLFIIKVGGYFDGCLASGYTRVAQNEFNAYLVCDFLLKVSRIANRASIFVQDDGYFIKCKTVYLKSGDVIVPYKSETDKASYEKLIEKRRIFSIVNPEKYQNLPAFRNQFPDYNKMTDREKEKILSDWNWLGFENPYDCDGDDLEGYDLNQKVGTFVMKEFV